MILHQKVYIQPHKIQIIQIIEKKKLQKIFIMVQGVPSDLDLIRRVELAQSDVYSHKMVELSTVNSSI